MSVEVREIRFIAYRNPNFQFFSYQTGKKRPSVEEIVKDVAQSMYDNELNTMVELVPPNCRLLVRANTSLPAADEFEPTGPAYSIFSAVNPHNG